MPLSNTVSPDYHDRKLALSFGAVVLLLMLAISSVAGYLFTQLYKKEEDRLVSMLAIIFSDSIGKVSFSGKYHARLFVEEIQGQIPALAFISVEDKAGKILAHSQPEKNDTYYHDKKEMRLRNLSLEDEAVFSADHSYDGQIIKEVVVPYRSELDNAVMGVVRLGIKMEEVQKEQRATVGEIVFLIIIVTLLAMGGVLLLSRHFGGTHRALAAQLQGILAHAPLPISITNKAGQLLASSNQGEQLFGSFTEGQPLAQYLEKQLAPTDIRKLTESNDKLFADGKPREQEIEIEFRGQSRVWNVSKFAIAHDAHGHPKLICTFVHDITERRQAEEALREGERQKDLILNATVEMVTYYDLDLNIIWANRAAAESIGKSPAELVGLHCHEIWHQCEEPCVGCPLVQARNDHAPRQGEVRNPAGRYWLVRGFPIFDETMQVSALVGFAQDITERKQAEEEREKIQRQLLQAQKMEAIGTLSGGIAHDFNNILSPILGYAEIALQTLPPDSPAASDIQEVLKAGHRAKDLVKQILILSRQAEQEIQPLKIQFIIKEVLKLLRATIPTTIQIRQNINPECGAVLADPTQIHQIVMNLCTNAYHAMRETGGVLGLALTPVVLGPDDLITTKIDLQSGLYLQLEVSDTGHGMDKTVLQRIFDPYYTTKAKGEGTGLGLSVVHGIVKSLYGDVSVYSEPGKGTTFHVYFPVVEVGGGKKDDMVAAGQLPKGNEHILFVDDEEVIVQMEQQMLGSLGYQVTPFSNVEEALKTYRTQPNSFDLIITDMTMPKITGLQFAKEVLAVRPDVPVILCTGFSELINEEKAREVGIRRYLTKPISKKDLAEAVRKVLDERTS